MRKIGIKMRIFIVIGLVFVISVVSGLYYISLKISPEEIKKQILFAARKQLPAVEVNLDEITYSIGTSVYLDVTNFSMKLKEKKSQNELLILKEAQIKIPFWSIISSSGAIEIYVKSPHLYYTEFSKEDNNWSMALAGSPVQKKEKSKGPASKSVVSEKALDNQAKKKQDVASSKIAGFFAGSSVNVKFIDIVVNYKLQKQMAGKIILSRFLVKNLNLKSETAFELASKFDVTLEKKKYGLESLVIGQVNLHEFILDKDLKTSIMVKLNNFKTPDIPFDIPTIESDLGITLLKKTGEIKGNVKTKFSNLGTVSLNLNIKKDNLLVDIKKGQFSIKELLSRLTPKLDMIRPLESEFNFEGQLRIKKGELIPNLSYELSPALSIQLPNELKVDVKSKGKIKNKDLEIFVDNNLFGGTANIKMNTFVDINNPPKQIESLSLIKTNVDLKNLKFPKDYIQKNVYAKKKNTKNSNQTVDQNNKQKQSAPTQVQKGQNELILPSTQTHLKWHNITFGNEPFNGKAKIITAKKQLFSKNITFGYGDGKGFIDFIVKLKSLSEQDANFKFRLNNLNLKSVNPFLPPMVEGMKGNVTGDVRGKTSILPKGIKYNIDMNLNVTKGAVKGLNIGQIVKGITDKISLLKGKVNDLKYGSNFERIVMVSNLRDNQYFFKQLEFFGINKSFEMKGKGVMYPPPHTKEGLLDFILRDHTGKISNVMEKNLGTKDLPIRLKGPGLNLMPDYAYTVGKLGKMALEVQKKKLEEKIKKEADKAKKKVKKKIMRKVNKEGEKILKDKVPKKEIKKLFDGLFN